MKVLIYCSDPADEKFATVARTLSATGIELVLMPIATCGRTYKARSADSAVYLDAEAVEIERILELGAKIGGFAPWGVLDRSGRIADPAALFRAGASDYLGCALCKKTRVIDSERLDRVAAYAAFKSAALSGPDDSGAEEENPTLSVAEKKRAFPGWDKLVEEDCYVFSFFYAAVADQRSLLVRLGEKRLDKLRDDFTALISAWTEERGGRLWIRDATSNLFIFPADETERTAAGDALRLLLNRPLICYENFRLEIPIGFHFAFHEGEAPWRRPGSTSTVVSEQVNLIYHLGTKAVLDDSIVVSEKAKTLIPACMADVFYEGEPFEGYRLWHSRRFV